MVKHEGFKVRPLQYVRNSGVASIIYLEGPNEGTQKDVPWSELTHPAGRLALVTLLRDVRVDEK